jgi:hypothetical protein
MTRDDEINVLADEIRKRRDGCILLLAVQVVSAVAATKMTSTKRSGVLTFSLDEHVWPRHPAVAFASPRFTLAACNGTSRSGIRFRPFKISRA